MCLVVNTWHQHCSAVLYSTGSASAKQEIRIWEHFWADSPMPELPATLSSMLDKINCRQFLWISAILNVLLLLPVSSAEVERAHSVFKLIKTRLRSTMGESCLNVLILLNFHKGISLNYDAVSHWHVCMTLPQKDAVCKPTAWEVTP